jgi:hypothetical protein
MRHASARRAAGRLVLIGALCLSAAAIGCGAASAASSRSATPNAQTARWVRKHLRFTYMGFTTHYSCEGLSDKVRSVLLQLGARREGLNVYPAGCVRNVGAPEPAPSVAGTVYVLEPTAESGVKAVRAHWHTVNVQLARSPLEQAGQCELLEQVRQRILPMFATRNEHFSSNCVPNQLTLPGAALRVEVLEADRPGGRDVAAAH